MAHFQHAVPHHPKVESRYGGPHVGQKRDRSYDAEDDGDLNFAGRPSKTARNQLSLAERLGSSHTLLSPPLASTDPRTQIGDAELCILPTHLKFAFNNIRSQLGIVRKTINTETFEKFDPLAVALRQISKCEQLCQEEFWETRNQVTRLSDDVEQLMAENQQLRTEDDQLKIENHQLRTQNEEVVSAFNQATQDLRDIKNDSNYQSQKRCEDLERQLGNLQTENQTLENARSPLRERISRLTAQLESRSKEIDGLKEQNALALKNASQAVEQIKQLNDDKTRLEGVVQGRDENVKSHMEENNRLNELCQKRQVEMIRLINKNTQLESQIQEYQTEIKQTAGEKIQLKRQREKIKHLTDEKAQMQSQLGESRAKIRGFRTDQDILKGRLKGLTDNKVQLESRFQHCQAEIKKLADEKTQLDSKQGKSQAEIKQLGLQIEQLTKKNSILEHKVSELQETLEKRNEAIVAKDDAIEKQKKTLTDSKKRLTNEKHALESRLGEREAEINRLKTETEAHAQKQDVAIRQYKDLIAELEDRISRAEHVSRIIGLPTTPVSDSHTIRDCGPSAPVLSVEHREPSYFPGPYVKHEASDPDYATMMSCGPPNWQTEAERFANFEKGVIRLLDEWFQVTTPRSHGLVLCFIEWLGLLSHTPATEADVGMMPTSFCGFKTLSIFTRTTPPLIMRSAEEEFAKLCFLMPCLESPGDQHGLYETVTELIASLLSSEHSSPTPALAFLEAISHFCLKVSHETCTPVKGLIAIMICELCRTIEHTNETAKRMWNIGAILGNVAAEELANSPIGHLDCALSRYSRSDPAWPIRIQEYLKANCDDMFCSFVQPSVDGKEEQMGVLHSGGTEYFVIINFTNGEMTVVDRSWATYQTDMTAPQKIDLVVRLRGYGEKQFNFEQASIDLISFWFRYAIKGR